MTTLTKAKIARYVELAGVLLSIPFMIASLPTLGMVVLIMLAAHFISGKLHKCQYGPQRWDRKKEEFYHLCNTCGDRVQGSDDSQ